jgi:hypothetical protein
VTTKDLSNQETLKYHLQTEVNLEDSVGVNTDVENDSPVMLKALNSEDTDEDNTLILITKTTEG